MAARKAVPVDPATAMIVRELALGPLVELVTRHVPVTKLSIRAARDDTVMAVVGTRDVEQLAPLLTRHCPHDILAQAAKAASISMTARAMLTPAQIAVAIRHGST